MNYNQAPKDVLNRALDDSIAAFMAEFDTPYETEWDVELAPSMDDYLLPLQR